MPLHLFLDQSKPEIFLHAGKHGIFSGDDEGPCSLDQPRLTLHSAPHRHQGNLWALVSGGGGGVLTISGNSKHFLYHFFKTKKSPSKGDLGHHNF